MLFQMLLNQRYYKSKNTYPGLHFVLMLYCHGSSVQSKASIVGRHVLSDAGTVPCRYHNSPVRSDKIVLEYIRHQSMTEIQCARYLFFKTKFPLFSDNRYDRSKTSTAGQHRNNRLCQHFCLFYEQDDFESSCNVGKKRILSKTMFL